MNPIIRTALFILPVFVCGTYFDAQAARQQITVNKKQITTGKVYELSDLFNDLINSPTKALAEFDAIVDSHTVFVDFWAPWCGPCKTMSPRFEELAKEADDILFIKVNYDKLSFIAKEYKAMSLPTFISFKDGKEVARINKGVVTKKQLKESSKIF